MSFTARIERAHSYRAGSGSTKDGLAAPYIYYFFAYPSSLSTSATF